MKVAASVPGPGFYSAAHKSFQRTRQQLPEEPGMKMYKSFRGQKIMGKQNEIGLKPHTFGADKDRFKDSAYGRLDLIAQLPGVGEYNISDADGKTAGDTRSDICVPVLPHKYKRPKTHRDLPTYLR